MEAVEIVRQWFGKESCHGTPAKRRRSECPHGKPIPIGPCCKRAALEVTSVVLPLCELSPGDRGRVAYLRTGNSQRLQKLLTLGILPGVAVEMLQRFPSFVFRIGHSQMAVDREMAEGIHVRLTGGKHKQ